MAHIKSWKVLRNSIGAALIAAETPMNWGRDLYGFPWPWISCFIFFFFLILHHQLFLWRLLPLLSNGKGNNRQKSKWRRRKCGFERQKEVGKSAVILPRWNSKGLDELLLSSAQVDKLQEKWCGHRDQASNFLPWRATQEITRPLLERQHDETALQFRTELLSFSLLAPLWEKWSCQHGYNGHIWILIFLLTLDGGAGGIGVIFLHWTNSVFIS